MAKDWYRKNTWTKDDEIEFFAKLKRSQKHKKPQYLRIQALTLYETGDAQLLDVALNLLQKYFDEYPDDKFERSSAYKILGDIYSKMEKFDISLQNYKSALDYEEIFPQVLSNAYLSYAKLIIQLNKTELFEGVEKLLSDRTIGLDFPKVKYIKNAILSIISKQKNDFEKANYYKNIANEAANAEVSGFRWHKKLGLVHDRDKLLDELMNN
ncbi:MAG: hypothetical protein LBS10_06030 [Gracilibacteraceae bacterium]|jgi:tetratricopeptide (TPR) repeat protein|nr:hypothetical protein [Gracilibacteraceae bacterium]